MEPEPTETVVYKTKPYVLRAVRNYYNKNKAIISKKNQLKCFQNKMENLLDTLENLDNSYIQTHCLLKIANYKFYQTNIAIRELYKDRITAIVEKVRTNDNHSDFDCLRLDSDDMTYTGNYGKK